eukprot:scaffold136047_cov37-Tisochrysis_lutea.AAC.2
MERVEVHVRLTQPPLVPPGLQPPQMQVIRAVWPQRCVERSNPRRGTIGQRQRYVQEAGPLVA